MTTFQLWKNKEERIVDPLLFSEKAEQYSKLFADQCEQNKRNGRSQVRKFYDEVIRLEMSTKSGQKKWEHVWPLVHMLIAKAAYAEGRKLVSKEFVQFIKDGVSQIKDPEDLKIFSSFFEAFMGFYRADCPRN